MSYENKIYHFHLTNLIQVIPISIQLCLNKNGSQERHESKIVQKLIEREWGGRERKGGWGRERERERKRVWEGKRERKGLGKGDRERERKGGGEGRDTRLRAKKVIQESKVSLKNWQKEGNWERHGRKQLRLQFIMLRMMWRKIIICVNIYILFPMATMYHKVVVFSVVCIISPVFLLSAPHSSLHNKH